MLIILHKGEIFTETKTGFMKKEGCESLSFCKQCKNQKCKEVNALLGIRKDE